jgi:hypothetical protein
VTLCPKLYIETMRRLVGLSRSAILAALTLGAALSAASQVPFAMEEARQPAAVKETNTQEKDPHAIYEALNALQPDPQKVYHVKNVELTRDVVHFTFDDGKLAFYRPLDGRITGVVFLGQGHVIATPRDPGERRSLSQYVGVPILDQTFSRAYLRFDDETASELQHILEASGVPSTPDEEFAESWQPVTSNLNSWHSLRLLIDWLSAAPLPYFYAALAGDAVGAFDVLVDQRRDEHVVFGQPRKENGVLFYDTWASFRGENEQTGSTAQTFVPEDYQVDTTIAEDLSLNGKTLMHLKAVRAGERVVPLELSRNLAIDQIQDKGESLVFFQNEDMSRREILRRGNDTVMAVLPEPAQTGEKVALEVSYHGNVITDEGNSVEFVGERGTWYAHVGGEHFVPFQLTFQWPKRLTLVATGMEIKSQTDGDFRIGVWKSQVPLSVAGFNLGEYDTETSEAAHPKVQLFANRVLESAIVARLEQNAADEAVTHSHTDASGVSRLPTIVTPPALPSPSSVLQGLGAEIEDSIHFFEKLNGPFPFNELDISQIPGSFGQGWPGLVYLSTLAFLPPETQRRAGIGTVAQQEARELMPFHEVVHQWWGNVTGAASYRDDWIQEGMANYLAVLYSDSRSPGKHRMNVWLERYRSALLEKAPGTQAIADEAGPLDLGIRLNSSKMPDAYVTVTYDKGTWVMHMLHEMLRDPESKDPDERFRELLQTILNDYRFRPLSTKDFQHAVELFMSPSMNLEGDGTLNWFFEEWVREAEIPHYAVQFQAKQIRQEFVVSGNLSQTEVREDFTEAVPLYSVGVSGKPEFLGVVITTGPETRFHFESRTKPARLLIDPNKTLLTRPN